MQRRLPSRYLRFFSGLASDGGVIVGQSHETSGGRQSLDEFTPHRELLGSRPNCWARGNHRAKPAPVAGSGSESGTGSGFGHRLPLRGTSEPATPPWPARALRARPRRRQLRHPTRYESTRGGLRRCLATGLALGAHLLDGQLESRQHVLGRVADHVLARNGEGEGARHPLGGSPENPP